VVCRADARDRCLNLREDRPTSRVRSSKTLPYDPGLCLAIQRESVSQVGYEGKTAGENESTGRMLSMIVAQLVLLYRSNARTFCGFWFARLSTFVPDWTRI
jgi:hypothetical protein